MTTEILVHAEAGVMAITLNRPERKNSITSAMYGAMADAIERARGDDAVRVVLLQGHETVFSAGNDINDFLNNPPAGENSPVFRFLHGIATFPKRCWPRCAGRRWAWARPCCSTATWSMPATTLRSRCPS